MCYRGIPPRGITAPSLSFEEVVVAHHCVATTAEVSSKRLRFSCPPSSLFALFVCERERERARFSLNRVTSRTKEYRLMTGCTLDSDLALFLVIPSTIKPGRDVPETGALSHFPPLSSSLFFFLSAPSRFGNTLVIYAINADEISAEI